MTPYPLQIQISHLVDIARIIITDPSVKKLYEGLLEDYKGIITNMKRKRDLSDYYFEVKVRYIENKQTDGWSNVIVVGIPEFELDKHYYREERLKKLLYNDDDNEL